MARPRVVITPQQALQAQLDKTPFIDGRTNRDLRTVQLWANGITNPLQAKFLKTHSIEMHMAPEDHRPAFAVSWKITERE
jgi:hypothetical protein